MPSCCECSISPERRKVTVGSAVLGSEEVPDSVLNQPITSEKRSQRKNQPTTVVEHKSLRTETPEKKPTKGSANTVWPCYRVEFCIVSDRCLSACHRKKDTTKFLNAW